MDARLQELFDHHDIGRVLAEYCHGCDRLDRTRMASVYLEDSWDDHGEDKCPGPEFATRATTSLAAGSNMCSHQLGQSLITVRGDEAGAETYFIATLRRQKDDGSETLNQLGGRYVDRLRRTGDGWKIEHRVCVRDWSITHPIVEDWAGNRSFVQGQRSGADPASEALSFSHSGLPALA